MKIYIVGSVKIDSLRQKRMFIGDLNSIETVKHLFCWNFNIVGKYGRFCAKEIIKRHKEAVITFDDASSYYEIIKKQVSLIDEKKALLFFLMEDHWFICPHKNLFFYLLEEFKNSKADVLRITHLVEFWERENAYDLIADKPLYKEYLINSDSLKRMRQKYPEAYIISLPGIFKKEFAVELLENNKSILNSKKPGGFELYGKKAEEFLNKRSFIAMAPNFHVLREVFLINQDNRAMDARKASKIIKLRDAPEPAIKSWRTVARLILAPRILAGRIKIKIKKITGLL